MALEQIGFIQEDKRKLSEKEIKEEIANKLELEKQKQSLLIRIEKDKQLAYLKSIVERWLIKVDTAKHIADWENLEKEELNEIFDKIDQIEEIDNINLILPEYHRISREEFAKWIEDAEFRKILLDKIDNALHFIYTSTHSTHSPVLGLFYNLMNNYDKKNKDLIMVQANLIDLKRSLMVIDDTSL